MYFVFKHIIKDGEDINEYLIKLENIDEVHYDRETYTLHIRADNYESEIDIEFEELKYGVTAFDEIKKYCLSLNSTIIGIK